MSGKKRKLLPEMEGRTARWYARIRGTENQLAVYRQQAAELTHALHNGDHVLEIAPGPGYLAIEIARLARFDVTGLDISQTLVEIARENAHKAGVKVDFVHGDAASIPFDADSFDLIVCQAAFKNFTAPVKALDEMYRVLKKGATAVIQDLSKAASRADIAAEVRAMKLSGFNAFVTKVVLGTVLRRRAYSTEQFERLARASAFQTCAIRAQGIGLEVRLKKMALQQAA